MNTLSSNLSKKTMQIALVQLAAYVLFIMFPSTVFAQSYSGPLVITKGGTYSGNWESKDSEVAAIEIKTSEPVIIENSNIRGAGPLIRSLGNKINLTIRHTKGYGLAPTPWKDYKKPRRFLGIDVFKSVVVENCYMENTAGIYIGQSYEGNGTASETIKIRYNIAKNIDGRVHGGTTFAQFVQFNFRNSIKHAEVAWNQVINDPNNSAVEDNINMHNSRGTKDSPIKIHNNYIQGAYPIPAEGKSYSGGGIITDGDGDINSCPAYIEAHDNQLIGLGNYSMGIAGGNNIRYHHNRAINAATFDNGQKYSMYTSGLWSNDYYKKNTTFDNSVDNNVVGIVAWGYNNNRNDVSVAEKASFTNNSFLPNPITKQMEKDEYSSWQNKLSKNGIVLGPNGSGGSAPANQAPNVSITSPSANTTFTQGDAINISANASDSDGSVTKVEFYQGSVKLGEDTTSPYNFNWSNAAAGSYNLTAKATDNAGATKTSSAIAITVAAPSAVPNTPSTPGNSGGGSITHQVWNNVGGSNTNDIPVNNNPSSTKTLTLFEAPANAGENFGQRIYGYVTAPESGKYTFWIAGDNNADLYLSSSEDPAKKTKIAYVNGWTNEREWEKYGTQKSAQVTLEAGKRYYIEALGKEEAGGDNLAVGWQLPGGSKEMPIAGNRLSPMGSTAAPAPAPTTPEPTPAPKPTPSTPVAGAEGKIMLEHWKNVNGSSTTNIPVSTTPSSTKELTLLEATANVGDNYGQRIRGYVTAPESGKYTFWIAGDNNADLYLSSSEDPAKKTKIAYVNGWTNEREWEKYGTQKSAQVTLEAGKRYYIEVLHIEGAGGDHVSVGWQLPSGSKEMPIAGKHLSTFGSTAVTTPTTPEPTPAPTTPVTANGKIVLEHWKNVSGESTTNIPVSTTPSSTKELTLLEATANVGDNYGQRIRGYVTAPESGKYTFWIAGDNNADLYLSSSEDPAKKTKIAYVNGWTNEREWEKYGTQKSAQVTLEAGKRYYIEVLHIEGAGGDHVSVGWQLPSGSKEMPIAGKHLSTYSESLASISAMQVSEVANTEPFFAQTTAYPNPFRDVVTLSFGGDKEVELDQVVVLTQTGRVVYEEAKPELVNNKLSMNLANLKTGLYILKYTDKAGNSDSIKLVKE